VNQKIHRVSVGFVSLVSLIALGSGVFGSNALASPALDIFDQASGTLQREYFGYSSLDLPKAIAKRRAELGLACKPQGESCAFEIAEPILDALTSDLGDDHTYYVNPISYRQQQRAIAGQGSSKTRFGLRTAQVPGTNARVVLGVREDGPAKLEGFRRGDRIYAVGGQAFPGDLGENNALWNRLEASGEAVVFSAIRSGQRFAAQLKARVFERAWGPSLEHPTDAPAGTEVLTIPSFVASDLSQQVHDLVRIANARGTTHLIVDLRFNGGGDLFQTMQAIGAFVNTCRTRYDSKGFSAVFNYNSFGPRGATSIRILDFLDVQLEELASASLFTGRVTVLINSSSASGAEVFAYSLQRAKRATVIGEPSYGVMGSSTNDFELIDGGALYITNGRSIGADGKPLPERVQPDLTVIENLEQITKQDLMLQQAMRNTQAP
jgi:carboxyl-terminal processing protease